MQKKRKYRAEKYQHCLAFLSFFTMQNSIATLQEPKSVLAIVCVAKVVPELTESVFAELVHLAMIEDEETDGHH